MITPIQQPGSGDWESQLQSDACCLEAEAGICCCREHKRWTCKSVLRLMIGYTTPTALELGLRLL